MNTALPPNTRIKRFWFTFGASYVATLDQPMQEYYNIISLRALTWTFVPKIGPFPDFVQLSITDVPVLSNTSTAAMEMTQLPLQLGAATDGHAYNGPPITIFDFDASRKLKLPPKITVSIFGVGTDPTALTDIASGYLLLEALINDS